MPEEDFNLHDFVKGTTASLGIPSQILREPTATSKPNRASIAWSLGVGIYSKVGGTPWKLAASGEHTAFIGIGYAVRKDGSGNPQFVTCCSQVFDSEGGSPEFVAYQTNAKTVTMIGSNPFLSREAMRAIMARSLSLYLESHAGALPSRVVVHKSTEFQKQEIEGCRDAFSRVPDLELIQIQADTPWRAVQVEKGYRDAESMRAANYPVKRGSLLYIGDYEVVLWAQGDAPGITFNDRSFFKEGVGIPRPMLLRRWLGTAGAETPATEILALTKMNWNNDSLYDTMPVTLGYASVLAHVLKTMPSLDSRPYPYRLFM